MDEGERSCKSLQTERRSPGPMLPLSPPNSPNSGERGGGDIYLERADSTREGRGRGAYCPTQEERARTADGKMKEQVMEVLISATT